MSLIVEDGTGFNNSESFCSVTVADTYHKNFGNSAWADLTIPEKEVALRKATAFLEQTYAMRWSGIVAFSSQALSWPREFVRFEGRTERGFVVPSTSVPREVQNACAVLALKSIDGPLAPDLGPAVVREKVGALEVEYAPHAKQTTQFREIDLMLAPYLSGAGNSSSVRIVRS